MIEFFQFLKGYVVILVTGYSPERFMNLCSNHDLLLWNIEKVEHGYRMCISLQGFKKIRPIVKKTRTRAVIQKRCGLPFLSSKIRRRKFFLLGFLLTVCMLIYSVGFIWTIELEGNYQISEDMMLDFLAEQQVFTGMKKKNLNIEELEQNLRRNFTLVTWTSAKLEGTTLCIYIKENDHENIADENEQLNIGTASDLVALQDGIITSMIVRKGTPNVQIGQEIKKGDILVYGRVPVLNEDGTVKKYHDYHADADILAEYELHQKFTLKKEYVKKRYTGRSKTTYFFRLFQKEYQLPFGKNDFILYDTVTNETQLEPLKNFFLPFVYGSYENREYYNEEKKYTNEEAKEQLNMSFQKFVQTLSEKGVQIIEKNVKINTKTNMWVLNADFRVQGEIGSSVPVQSVEEINEEPLVGDENGGF